VPEEGVPAKGTERWQRIRRLATFVSAVIAAIGIASGLIGYLTTGAQFFSDIEEYFQGRSVLHSLIAAANDRLAQTDYEAAWRANAKARQLAPRNAAAAEQQARIAMKWLENVHLSSSGGPQYFSDVVDPLKAALVERLAGTHDREKADVHAHIGWANFLRYRDGRPKSDIGEEFDAAIREDPDNLYGHVMRGFWILWEGGPIDKARGDLDLALRSSTDPAFSDGLVMASLTNITSSRSCSSTGSGKWTSRPTTSGALRTSWLISWRPAERETKRFGSSAISCARHRAHEKTSPVCPRQP
jgi:hypothetical protein